MTPKETYLKLLDELHALELAGKGDGEEYDAVTDKMDRPWIEMTGEERKECRAYSSQLNKVAANTIQLRSWECLQCARVFDATADDYCPNCGKETLEIEEVKP